ncbi:MAG TPA: hypothetical protein V6D27_01495 [Vampirovibrionales bacterium]
MESGTLHRVSCGEIPQAIASALGLLTAPQWRSLLNQQFSDRKTWVETLG